MREAPRLPRHWEPLVSHLYETRGEFAESWDYIVSEVKGLAWAWAKEAGLPVEDKDA